MPSIRATAPSKVILFGEHAVVYGEPAIAVAIGLRTHVRIEKSERYMVNGYPLDEKYHSYILNALKLAWDDDPLEISTVSEVPSASGMGSSASVTVATLAALLAGKKKMDRLREDEIAKLGFEVEYITQGRASPIDTSTVTHGMGILVDRVKRDNFLWRIEKNGVVWNIHHIQVPSLKLVVGFSGVKGATADMVAKVRRFYQWSSFAREIIREIGKITMEAVPALENGDYGRIGELMDRNNKLLTILGVNHPMLRRMISAARRYSYGAKITGAGGGGSMVALTDEQDEVAKAIEEVGGVPYKVSISSHGFQIENHL